MAGYDGGGGRLGLHQALELDFAFPSGGRFYVELTPGETTVVSWKKLHKERKNLPACPPSNAPSGAHPTLQARIAPLIAREMDFVHPVNRFSSVIERIERLYQGVNRDNELNECAEGDTYDTDDSFIDDTELDDYFSVDNMKLKHEGFFVNKGKLEEEFASMASAPTGTNKIRRNVLKKSSMGLQAAPKESTARREVRVESLDPSFKCSKARKLLTLEVKGIGVDGCQLGDGEWPKDVGVEKTMKEIISHKSGKGIALSKVQPKRFSKYESRRNDVTHNAVTIDSYKNDKPSLAPAKKVALTSERLRPCFTALEKAVLDLENEVTEVYSLARNTERGRSSYLPRSIKQKLEKVAKLAIKKGGSSDKLVKRLHGILGHLIEEVALKKVFKVMLEVGSSTMQKKETRLKVMKSEVAEMIKSRVSQLQKQLEIPCFKIPRRFRWDHAIEEKVCDLCEHYIEDVDEDKGLHLKELYVELIKLWPKGWMDNMGIKLAVHRAKERRKLSFKARSVKKRQGKNFVDDKASIFEILAKSPSLGNKARAMNNLKRESNTNDEHWPLEKKVKREVDKSLFHGGSQVYNT
ncbi:hypothetical protein L7F22_025189 [Adiantum nelumboides]|nr:hypothetical protein [Adiantum nelumboides]